MFVSIGVSEDVLETVSVLSLHAVIVVNINIAESKVDIIFLILIKFTPNIIPHISPKNKADNSGQRPLETVED